MIDLDIEGATVEKVDNVLPVSIFTSNDWMIKIESDIHISPSIAESGVLDGEDPDTISILKESITGLEVVKVEIASSRLHLEFEGSIAIDAQSDPDFESWGVVGPYGQRIECMPGGELAVWPERPSE
ncbi:DUF6188 family protein [Haloglycomyces albus]|uniref:DUF6188 family protein n=1 Tax=Haloglycomyces albus TaxID=526067 RepID=UPI0004BAF0A3|nr:DUF6188 family protein [Haloglycomyces albus]